MEEQIKQCILNNKKLRNYVNSKLYNKNDVDIVIMDLVNKLYGFHSNKMEAIRRKEVKEELINSLNKSSKDKLDNYLFTVLNNIIYNYNFKNSKQAQRELMKGFDEVMGQDYSKNETDMSGKYEEFYSVDNYSFDNTLSDDFIKDICNNIDKQIKDKTMGFYILYFESQGYNQAEVNEMLKIKSSQTKWRNRDYFVKSFLQHIGQQFPDINFNKILMDIYYKKLMIKYIKDNHKYRTDFTFNQINILLKDMAITDYKINNIIIKIKSSDTLLEAIDVINRINVFPPEIKQVIEYMIEY